MSPAQIVQINVNLDFLFQACIGNSCNLLRLSRWRSLLVVKILRGVLDLDSQVVTLCARLHRVVIHLQCTLLDKMIVRKD